MERLLIIGCPGSGKSTLSRSLKDELKLEVIHLDALYWNVDGTTVEVEIFQKRLNEALAKESWIIDGNYLGSMEQRLQRADSVIFLDYDVEICLKGIKERRGQKRSDMPWVEDPNDTDEEFVEFVKNYELESKPKVLELLTKYPDKEIYIFKSREETNEWLKKRKHSN